MSNIIKANFGPDEEKSGYLMEDGSNGLKVITGVYCGDIAAMKLADGSVVNGTKNDDSIEQATLVSMDEMNKFCLMWLCIFDPSVVKFDED